MPASFVQANGIYVTTSASALTASALSITTGNYIIAYASHYTSAGINISAITQVGGGNTLVKAGSSQGNDANEDIDVWYTPSPIVGTTSAVFVVGFTGLAAFRVLQVAEFSWGGTASISYEAEAAYRLISGSALTSNTLTPIVSDNLIFGGWTAATNARSLSSGTATLIGPATGATADDFALGYRLVDSVSAYTVSLVSPNTTDTFSVIAKAFKAIASVGGAAAPLKTLPLTGAGAG